MNLEEQIILSLISGMCTTEAAAVLRRFNDNAKTEFAKIIVKSINEKRLVFAGNMTYTANRITKLIPVEYSPIGIADPQIIVDAIESRCDGVVVRKLIALCDAMDKDFYIANAASLSVYNTALFKKFKNLKEDDSVTLISELKAKNAEELLEDPNANIPASLVTEISLKLFTKYSSRFGFQKLLCCKKSALFLSEHHDYFDVLWNSKWHGNNYCLYGQNGFITLLDVYIKDEKVKKNLIDYSIKKVGGKLNVINNVLSVRSKWNQNRNGTTYYTKYIDYDEKKFEFLRKYIAPTLEDEDVKKNLERATARSCAAIQFASMKYSDDDDLSPVSILASDAWDDPKLIY